MTANAMLDPDYWRDLRTMDSQEGYDLEESAFYVSVDAFMLLQEGPFNAAADATSDRVSPLLV
jgi:hypothetical protein